ncbi:uncharacterized protein [Spinacia oleracea]|uniref:Granulins domain-containing protein n=1 Tax=Spinacia oleracea TaxID=3562 RepID=A0ABM3QWD0_SPIOL|nr:uncharacterized protein LOC130462789 [Spinacia oleracea]
MKITNSQKIKLACSFLIVAVLLQILAMKVEAGCSGAVCPPACPSPCVCGFTDGTLKRCCNIYDAPCDPLAPTYECCDTLTCLQVTPGVFKCKEKCEDHPNHECYPGLYECCEDSGLSCVSMGGDTYNCV